LGEGGLNGKAEAQNNGERRRANTSRPKTAGK
jgi:hypothetical protein